MDGVMPTKLIKAGEIIFKEGDIADGLYYICYGQVEIFRENEEAEQGLALLEEGAVFGELAIINSSPRTATAKATEDTGLYVMNHAAFQNRVDELDSVMRGMFRLFVMEIRSLLGERDRLERELYKKKLQKDTESTQKLDLAHKPGQRPMLDKKLDF